MNSSVWYCMHSNCHAYFSTFGCDFERLATKLFSFYTLSNSHFSFSCLLCVYLTAIIHAVTTGTFQMLYFMF